MSIGSPNPPGRSLQTTTPRALRPAPPHAPPPDPPPIGRKVRCANPTGTGNVTAMFFQTPIYE